MTQGLLQRNTEQDNITYIDDMNEPQDSAIIIEDYETEYDLDRGTIINELEIELGSNKISRLCSTQD